VVRGACVRLPWSDGSVSRPLFRPLHHHHHPHLTAALTLLPRLALAPDRSQRRSQDAGQPECVKPAGTRPDQHRLQWASASLVGSPDTTCSRTTMTGDICELRLVVGRWLLPSATWRRTRTPRCVGRPANQSPSSGVRHLEGLPWSGSAWLGLVWLQPRVCLSASGPPRIFLLHDVSSSRQVGVQASKTPRPSVAASLRRARARCLFWAGQVSANSMARCQRARGPNTVTSLFIFDFTRCSQAIVVGRPARESERVAFARRGAKETPGPQDTPPGRAPERNGNGDESRGEPDGSARQHVPGRVHHAAHGLGRGSVASEHGTVFVTNSLDDPSY
jgi:hypothetical protein